MINTQPIYKNENREIKSKYRPISLLPICGKTLEKVVFDKLYAFLNTNNLFPETSQVFDLVIQLFVNYSPLPRLFMKPLKTMMKLVRYFWTFLRHSIRFGTKV